jgi:hypothetical protein
VRYILSLLILALLLSGCSKKSSTADNHEANIYINVDFSTDPLITTIQACRVNVTAGDLSTAMESAATVAIESDSEAVVSAYVVPGDDREVTLYFSQQSGAIIYWANFTVDIPADSVVETTVFGTQAAAASATRIKIFRDNLPWDSEAMDDVLSDIGISLGAEENQYQVVNSAYFDTITLVAGEDLVIVANDQSQEFYDNYYASRERINTFILEGGTIFWEACDLGWARGSISEAGIALPGNAGIVSGYQSHNYLTSSLWHLTAGLDSTLVGNYASHEGFINLPDGALAYTLDSRGLPTLVSFNYGVGWVILSGQPLEYSYDRLESYNSGLLLPRILCFVLGLDYDEAAFTGAAALGVQALDTRSSGE